jgi:hypothetical protein
VSFKKCNECRHFKQHQKIDTIGTCYDHYTHLVDEDDDGEYTSEVPTLVWGFQKACGAFNQQFSQHDVIRSMKIKLGVNRYEKETRYLGQRA